MSVSGFPRRLPSPVGRAIVTVLRWPGGESECAEEGHAFASPCLGLGDDGNREVQPGDETRQREGRGTLVVGGVIREKVGERGALPHYEEEWWDGAGYYLSLYHHLNNYL